MKDVACTDQRHRPRWRVAERRPGGSAYSKVTCTACGLRWRTRAGYVAGLPDVGQDRGIRDTLL